MIQFTGVFPLNMLVGKNTVFRASGEF